MPNLESLSIIIPARNEASSLRKLLPVLRRQHPESEIIVVNDGSADDTSVICRESGVAEVTHPYRKGNGAVIKSGARAASGNVFIFMDADGQHDPQDIPRLLEKLHDGYEMVVGSRSSSSQADIGRS